MKLFQQLLVAPAALGLMAPMAATAAELNMKGVSDYSASGQEVQSISQFSDVYPTDWAYQALIELADRHNCNAANPAGSMTRYEAAALLNACLGNAPQANAEERRLLNEFAPELAVIKGRADALEVSASEFEAGMFSTTTSVSGTTSFVLGSADEADYGQEEGTVFLYDTKINVDTSFNGDDLLKTTIRAGNFTDSDPFGASGRAALEIAHNNENLSVHRSYYQFPYGDNLTVTVGPKVRQDDMLGVWPSDYPSDAILDILTYAGANAAYSLTTGAGAGVTWAQDSFSGSLVYVGEEGADANANTGGIGTHGGSEDITGQLAWVGDDFTLAAVYTNADGGRITSAASNDAYNAYGLSGVYQPSWGSSWAPSSISAGYGWKNVEKADDDGPDDHQTTADDVEDSTTWTIGLLWDDAFFDGNTLGFAIGTGETNAWGGHIDDKYYDDPLAWEVFYQIAVSDNITVTPALFGVGGNNSELETDTVTGALVKTTFSF